MWNAARGSAVGDAAAWRRMPPAAITLHFRDVMAKIIVLLLALGALAYVGLWVWLVHSYGFLGLLGPLLVLPLLLWVAKVILAHQCRRLITAPFKMKGAVLHDATATVHAVSAAAAPGAETYTDDADLDLEDTGSAAGLDLREVDAERDEFVRERLDSDAQRNWYYVDVTIAPRPRDPAGNGETPFQHWDAMDLSIARHDARPDSDDDDGLCVIAHVEIWREDHWAELDSDLHGEARLRLHVGLEPGHTRLRFQYYFELFGQLDLPQNATFHAASDTIDL